MDDFFTRVASKSARALGQPLAFILSVLFVLLWAASGPLLQYSDTWQLIVNTATTVLTFLAVFLIHGKDSTAAPTVERLLERY